MLIIDKELHVGLNRLTIDLSALNNGMYFCQVSSFGEIQTMKIIKQ